MWALLPLGDEDNFENENEAAYYFLWIVRHKISKLILSKLIEKNSMSYFFDESVMERSKMSGY